MTLSRAAEVASIVGCFVGFWVLYSVYRLRQTYCARARLQIIVEQLASRLQHVGTLVSSSKKKPDLNEAHIELTKAVVDIKGGTKYVSRMARKEICLTLRHIETLDQSTLNVSSIQQAKTDLWKVHEMFVNEFSDLQWKT